MEGTYRATLRVAEGGRVVIPAEARDRLGLHTGSELLLTVEGDRATLMSSRASRRRCRSSLPKYIKPGTKLSEELMAERKREASRE